MKDEIDYNYCYRVLELPYHAGHGELKACYRKLVNQWHPDKQLEDQPEEAAEKIRQINIAYDRLSAYFKENRHLPFEHLSHVNEESQWEDTGPVETTSASQQEADLAHRRVQQVKKAGAGLMAASFAFFLYTCEDLRQRDPVALPTPPPVQASLAKIPAPASPEEELHKWFTYGDRFIRVLEVQGSPDREAEDKWYYGNSWVQFEDGRVKDWYSDDDHPIYATISTGDRRQLIRVGSSKKTVREIQGEPDIKMRNSWTYGNSTIYFQDGRVTHWNNSAMNPLKVELSFQ